MDDIYILLLTAGAAFVAGVVLVGVVAKGSCQERGFYNWDQNGCFHQLGDKTYYEHELVGKTINIATQSATKQ